MKSFRLILSALCAATLCVCTLVILVAILQQSDAVTCRWFQ